MRTLIRDPGCLACVHGEVYHLTLECLCFADVAVMIEYCLSGDCELIAACFDSRLALLMLRRSEEFT